MPRKLTSLAVTIALLCVGTNVGPAQADSTLTDLDDFAANPAFASFYKQKVSFDTACDIPSAQELECATILVPKTWHDASKGSLTLRIGRLKGSSPAGKRLLLSNPGGPGGSGLGFGAEGVPALLGTSSTHYAVGIDPRGVGASSPLSCLLPKAEKDAAADGDISDFTAEQYAAGLRNEKAITAACLTPEILESFTTEQTARDFNFVRALLGFEQADYYGVSYGTLLGSVAAKMFPLRFDRVLLDGNMDWQNINFDEALLSQAKGLQAAFDGQLLPWVARHDDVWKMGTHPQEVDLALLRNLRRIFDPAMFNTPEYFYSVTRMLLGAPVGYGSIADAMAAQKSIPTPPSQEHAAKRFRQKYSSMILDDEPTPVRMNPLGLSIQCADTPSEHNAAAWHSRVESLARTFHVGALLTMAPSCYGTQPAKPALTPEILNRPYKQILMLQQEADHATPYWGAYNTLTRSNRATTKMVLVDNAKGHGASYLRNRCAMDLVTGYLLKGTFPTTDAVCQSTPLTESRWDEQGTEHVVTEAVVYEFGNAGQGSQLPRPVLYPMRVLRPQQAVVTRGVTSEALEERPALSPAALRALQTIAEATTVSR